MDSAISKSLYGEQFSFICSAVLPFLYNHLHFPMSLWSTAHRYISPPGTGSHPFHILSQSRPHASPSPPPVHPCHCRQCPQALNPPPPSALHPCRLYRRRPAFPLPCGSASYMRRSLPAPCHHYSPG